MKGFSNRFFKQGKQVKLNKALPPRSEEEIKKEYAQVLGKAAQAGYQAYVYQKELSRLNEKLEALNLEDYKRQESTKSETPAPEVKNEQS